MKKKIIYQVLPRLWKNGKFSDWDDASFKYLKSLGINSVWYTGVIRHASGQDWVKGNPGCPYSISDYMDVNPYLASSARSRMKEFDQLVARTHAAGMDVIIDFIPNHVSRQGASGIPTYDRFDYDWSDTLKINYSHPDTWGKMLDIVLFWCGKGVDGFRCDMVELVPPDFLAWLIAEVKKIYPDTFFIAEVYGRQNYWKYVYEVGFDLLYDKSGLYDYIRAVICHGFTAKSMTWNWQSLGDMQTRMLNFMENHDEQRIASEYFAGSPDKGLAGMAVCALFNNASVMIYSGQECGESASDTPDGRTSIYEIKLPKSLANPDRKILTQYRKLMKLSSKAPFDGGDNWDLCYCNHSSQGFNLDRHFAFLRKNSRKAYAVVCNFSDCCADMDLYIPQETGLAPGSFEVSVPAWGYSVIEIPTN